ncbi:MAG: hypothetical protein KC897_01600 [Candidatus Omnitrophica bacterium]|nr:hypothetical protein [Candidatus Omnitrophota bacterium]MCB9720191.1 hypothetical protein [Candidatus Omnitrophota bacterium]
MRLSRLMISFLATFLLILPGYAGAQEPTRILWRDQPRQQLHINLDYINNSPEHIRAILAFLSTRGGTACQQTESNVVTVDLNDPDLLELGLADLFTPVKLTCELTAGVGYDDQCSEDHIRFVKKWFHRDAAVFQELDSCARTAATDNNRTVFDSLEIEEDAAAVTVRYTITQWNPFGTKTESFADRYELQYDTLQRTAHEIVDSNIARF